MDEVDKQNKKIFYFKINYKQYFFILFLLYSHSFSSMLDYRGKKITVILSESFYIKKNDDFINVLKSA